MWQVDDDYWDLLTPQPEESPVRKLALAVIARAIFEAEQSKATRRSESYRDALEWLHDPNLIEPWCRIAGISTGALERRVKLLEQERLRSEMDGLGLRDKNGRELFKGDLVKIVFWDAREYGGRVNYDSAMAAWRVGEHLIAEIGRNKGTTLEVLDAMGGQKPVNKRRKGKPS